MEQRPLCAAGRALTEWLAENDKTQQWLAERMGIGRAVVWRWLVGERTPHIDSASEIERLTGIPASTWATTDALRPPATGTEG